MYTSARGKGAKQEQVAFRAKCISRETAIEKKRVNNKAVPSHSCGWVDKTKERSSESNRIPCRFRFPFAASTAVPLVSFLIV